MKRAFTAAAASAVLLTTGLVLAQRTGAPGYDASKEKTLSGTVEEIVEGPRGKLGPGLHATLAVAGDRWDVRLGPRSFARSVGLALAKGDTIEVVGSADEPRKTLIAREVRKGEKSYRLRDERGFPLWRRARR